MSSTEVKIPIVEPNKGFASPILIAAVIVVVIILGYFLFKKVRGSKCWSLREKFKRLEDRQKELLVPKKSVLDD